MALEETRTLPMLLQLSIGIDQLTPWVCNNCLGIKKFGNSDTIWKFVILYIPMLFKNVSALSVKEGL